MLQALLAVLASQHDKALTHELSTPDMPLNTFLFYTAFSPMTSLLVAFNGYIDFAYQVPFILATTCIHASRVPMLNCAFMRNPSQALPLLTTACDWVTQLPRLLLVELHSLEHAIDQKLCTEHNSGVVYMLFMYVFIATMLPLVFTFRTERRMKLQWLRLSGHGGPAGHQDQPIPAAFEVAGLLITFLVSLIVTWMLSLLPMYDGQQCDHVVQRQHAWATTAPLY
jgi:hypothetical protein